jgi:hypothetical protein
MANPEHLKILKQGVEAWNNWKKAKVHPKPDLSRVHLRGIVLSDADFRSVDLSEVDFSKAKLIRANLSGAKLSKAKLDGADLSEGKLDNADLRWVSLRGAGLVRAKLVNTNLAEANLNKAVVRVAEVIFTNMEGANLENVDFSYSSLVGTNLTDANLTGIKLYGTSRDDWIIKNVECRYVYWDEDGEQRTPKDRDLELGEFEQIYATLPTVEYIFENGMTPIDPMIMDRVVQSIRENRPDFDIKIDSINARGLAPSIKFTVQQEEHKEPALQQVQKEYEIKLKQLESERDRYYQLLARALDAPKEVKLIAAGPGAIVATDGSTISIQQHIHNVLELQKAIADEPEESESFAKVAKRTALDIIGEAIKDIAKGQVKEAAKQIIELGKDLGPVIARMAAYAFFSNIGG